MPLPQVTLPSTQPRWWPFRGAIVAVAIFSFCAISEALEAHVLPALFPSQTPDFFIIRSGAVIALRGGNPYEPETVQGMLARQFPNDQQLIDNSAFFLPPATIVLYAPLAALPYPVAKIAWAIGLILSAMAVLLVLRTFGTRWPSSAGAQFLPVIVLLNYLTLAIVELGQTSFLFVGCVLAGQWCFERSRNTPRSRWRIGFHEVLGAFLWSIPFIKPHLALSLLPLAWYLGGWKRPILILVMVAGLNVAGCLMIGHSPLFLWDYVQYLGSTHKEVIFNRVERNSSITSWNKLLFGLGGPLVELTATTTVASYLVWFGVVSGRAALAGKLPSVAWAAAITAIGGVLCSQVLIYELLLLVLVIPWIIQLYTNGYRTQGLIAIGLIVFQFIPVGTMFQFGILFHHSLGVALLAMLVLVGPSGRAELDS